jgi:hypothetical protein
VIRKLTGGRASLFAGAALLVFASPLFAPKLLAFPHRVETRIGPVWSERPIDGALLDRIANQTRERLATSPIAGANERRPIFLTDGGWRWHWLAISARGSFALTRPISNAVVVNRIDDSGTIRNGREIGGERELAPVLAHEFTHGTIRRHFGILRAATFPQWKVEGYCDHVAQESALDAATVERLENSGTEHPALIYYHGRHRVAAELERNGGSVDRLFTGSN